LLSAGADVNAAVDHITAPWAASKGGHLEVAKRLLTAGVDANAARAGDGIRGGVALREVISTS